MLRNIDGMTALQKFPILTKQICFRRKITNSIHFQFDLNAHEGLWLKLDRFYIFFKCHRLDWKGFMTVMWLFSNYNLTKVQMETLHLVCCDKGCSYESISSNKAIFFFLQWPQIVKLKKGQSRTKSNMISLCREHLRCYVQWFNLNFLYGFLGSMHFLACHLIGLSYITSESSQMKCSTHMTSVKVKMQLFCVYFNIYPAASLRIIAMVIATFFHFYKHFLWWRVTENDYDFHFWASFFHGIMTQANTSGFTALVSSKHHQWVNFFFQLLNQGVCWAVYEWFSTGMSWPKDKQYNAINNHIIMHR